MKSRVLPPFVFAAGLVMLWLAGALVLTAYASPDLKSAPRAASARASLGGASPGVKASLAWSASAARQFEQPQKQGIDTAGVLLAESFDGITFPPVGWGTTIMTGTIQGWSRVTSGSSPSASPHSGAGMARCNSYSLSSGRSTRLYTPILDLTGQAALRLSFWMYHDTDYTGNNDRIQVQVSTNGGISFTTLTTISRYDGASGWKRHGIDLSAYTGQSNMRLGFLGISGWGNNMYVEDVIVGSPMPDYESSTESVQAAGPIYHGQTLAYTIVIRNAGGTAGTATTLHDPIPTGAAYIPDSATVQGGGVLTATAMAVDWSGTVNDNQSITVTFQVTITALAGFITNTATLSDPMADGPVVRSATVYALGPDYSRSVKNMWPVGVITTGQSLTYTIVVHNSGPMPKWNPEMAQDCLGKCNGNAYYRG